MRSPDPESSTRRPDPGGPISLPSPPGRGAGGEGRRASFEGRNRPDLGLAGGFHAPHPRPLSRGERGDDSSNRSRGGIRGLCLLAAVVALATAPAIAQQADKPAEKKDKADDVFDDKPADKDKDKKAEDKPKADDKAKPKADDKKPADKPKAKADETPKPNATTPAEERDSLGFAQETAASQMAELEDRMYRLSEALRGLEPENASRLRLALKFSREELILEQMRETNKLLKEAQVNRAETEVRELLAKLEHLRDLLLAEDLDFQLRLARLRQLRETIGQLDRIVKEERRLLGWSRFAVDQRKARERLAARRQDLGALARDQAALVAEMKAVPSGDDSSRKESARPLVDREGRIRKGASALADDPTFAEFQPSKLRQVGGPLGEAEAKLKEGAMAGSIEAGEKAAGLLADELAALDARIADADRDVSEAEFRRHESDQRGNRRGSDALAANSARLGDAGVSLQKDLIRAASSMRAAEEPLDRSEPAPASVEQSAALDVLGKGRDDLARAAERLLVVLRIELQRRLIAEITEMHEAQASIRESTQALAPRLAQKSRTALIAVAGLSKKEAELAGQTERLLALVEETEYGIALPTTLRVLGREEHRVEGWLKDGDASAKTVGLATRIEDDLLAMLQSIRRLPPTTPPPPGSPLPSDPREQERELNRLVAELKLIRLLQTRLNDDTVGFDKSRPALDALPPALRREIEGLESAQDEIRDALGRIAERAPQQ